MMAYENDTLYIPENYKKMSVSEIKKEKERMLKQILSGDRPRKDARGNNNIVFKF